MSLINMNYFFTFILYLFDKFNATVPYGTAQYGTGLTIFTCGISNLDMSIVLAAGPSRI